MTGTPSTEFFCGPETSFRYFTDIGLKHYINIQCSILA